MNIQNSKVLISLFCLLLLVGCSTTKNLPEGEVLYTGIDKLDIMNEDETPAGITHKHK